MKTILNERQLHTIKEQRIAFLLVTLMNDKTKAKTKENRSELMNNYTYYLLGVADMLDTPLSALLNELDNDRLGLHDLRHLYDYNSLDELYTYIKREQRYLREKVKTC